MSFDIPSKLRIGVLPPNSNFVPFLAKDMLAALKLASEEVRLDAEFIIESAGYNADSMTLAPAIQRLILMENVDCIIAPLNVSQIEKNAGYFEGHGIPLIALNLTEDPLFEIARNPFIFVNNFYLWQSAWMSGYTAARRFGKQGSAIVALHEGGYNLMFAFQLGLEAAGGGLVKASVTHINSNNEDPIEKIREIAAQNPDFIWAAYSGKEAISFLRAFECSDFKNKIPVITIPTMVSQNIRDSVGESLHGIWYLAAENSQHGQSSDSLSSAIGREANPYAVLAYEAIRLIAEAVKNVDETNKFAETFPELLNKAKHQSRRGFTQFNKYSSGDVFYLQKITDKKDECEKITAPPILNEQYQLACKKLVKEGWVNPYLCA